MTEIPSGSFYLGSKVNPETQKKTESPLLYESAAFTTHGVIVGMTGSGKTGLSMNLLEEALVNRIPVIIIDPKGDMPNLALQFPNLSPDEFSPWINEEDAKRQNQTVKEYAATIARSWATGLEKSGIGRDRIKKLVDNTEFTIYTPGSDSGVPVNILDSFRAPESAVLEDQEALTEAIGSTTQSLLGLLGIEGNPVQSKEFILISNILQDRWKQGEDLTLESIIGYVVDPPVRKLGVFEVDSLFPKKERMELAMLLNNVIASPGFAGWTKGEPLNPEKWLRDADKTPCSIFYIAHLSDAERMFFVTLLLGRIISCIRTMPGTTELRALLYFDEVFGYLPPYPANPPSKNPILTILKQARAFGLGMVLATQNPVDLDYKALTNAGTWMIGKLQTDRDKKRILDGLESSAGGFDKGEMDSLISKLGSRNFILHSARLSAPEVFHTRFSQAYLRGPVTKIQVKEIMKGRKAAHSVNASPAVSTPAAANRQPAKPQVSPAAAPVQQKESRQQYAATASTMGISSAGSSSGSDHPDFSAVMPTLPEIMGNFFLGEASLDKDEIRSIFEAFSEKSDKVLYRPALFGRARIRFDEEKKDLVHYEEKVKMIFPLEGDSPPAWQPENIVIEKSLVFRKPMQGALYGSLPQWITGKKDAAFLHSELVDTFFREESISVMKNDSLKLLGKIGESRDEFEKRCAAEVENVMNTEQAKIQRKYQTRIDTITRKTQKTMSKLEDARAEEKSRKSTEMVNIGESILGFLTSSRRSVGRAVSGAMDKRRMTEKAGSKAKQTELELELLADEAEKLRGEMDDELEIIRQKYADKAMDIEETRVSVEKADINILEFGILWVPVSKL
ncbi:MAG: DUF87 domain-containing protein [Firmicutes bacterium]|nr:DUF87 domain-containing protein [Bacillota bacterium]